VNDKDESEFKELIKWFGAKREDEARFYFSRACEYKDKYLQYLETKYQESCEENENWEKLYNELLNEKEHQSKKLHEIIDYLVRNGIDNYIATKLEELSKS
jgi:hypothetical protein